MSERNIVESFMGGVREELDGTGKDVKFNRQRLAKLHEANLPTATAADIATVNPKTPEDQAEADVAIGHITDYLKVFLPPGPCPCCERKYAFRWGIAHGEGFCRCGYPGRAHHDIPNIGRITNLILWYHPSDLSFDRKPGYNPK